MLRKALLALICMALSLTTAPAFAGTNTQSPEARSATTQTSPNVARSRAPKPGSTAEMKRYQARQDASPNAKEFRGGDVVVIGAGTLALALVIVLLIVLL